MATEIVCPQCASDDDLRGVPLGDGLIELTCEACELTWTRDPRPACPTCGSTRVVMAIGTGRPLDAIRHNPLVALGVVALVAWLVMRIGFGRQPQVEWTSGRRRFVITLVAVAAAVNWVYVIRENL